MATYKGQNFSSGKVRLDGNSFDGCRFENVTLEYGGGRVELANCHFGRVEWSFDGDLGNGLDFLGHLYGSFGLTDRLVEMLASLVQARAPQPTRQ
jgi:hypothetical protein